MLLEQQAVTADDKVTLRCEGLPNRQAVDDQSLNY